MTQEEMFAHELALAFGWPSPLDLLDALSFRTYESWKRFYNVQPFGNYRSDVQSAIIAKCVLAPWATSDLPLTDFMPFAETDEDVDVDALERHIEEQRAREQAERRAKRGDKS